MLISGGFRGGVSVPRIQGILRFLRPQPTFLDPVVPDPQSGPSISRGRVPEGTCFLAENLSFSIVTHFCPKSVNFKISYYRIHVILQNVYWGP